MTTNVKDTKQMLIRSSSGPGRIAGVLKQIRQGLKPDGFFLGSMIGGDSVFELRRVDRVIIAGVPSLEMVGSETDRQWFLRRGRNRTALQLAEMNQSGGVSPRISPMAGEHPHPELAGLLPSINI